MDIHFLLHNHLNIVWLNHLLSVYLRYKDIIKSMLKQLYDFIFLLKEFKPLHITISNMVT